MLKNQPIFFCSYRQKHNSMVSIAFTLHHLCDYELWSMQLLVPCEDGFLRSQRHVLLRW